MCEIRPIAGFEGKYSATSTGKIFSDLRYDKFGRCFGGKFLKQRLDKYGYPKVGLTIDNRKSKIKSVHRIIAETFIENPDNLPCVNHKDGNKENNCISNLEWCSWKDNTQHAWNTGLCKTYDRSLKYNREGIIASNRRRRKYTFSELDIINMKKLYSDGLSQEKIAILYNTKQGTISQCLRGELHGI